MPNHQQSEWEDSVNFLKQRIHGKVTSYYSKTGIRPKMVFLGQRQKKLSPKPLLRFMEIEIVYIEKEDHVGCGE